MKDKIPIIVRGGEDLERLYLYSAYIKSEAGVVEVKKSHFPLAQNMGDVVMRHLGRYGFALPFIRPGYRVLDFPCGSGLALEVFGLLQQFGQFAYEGRDLDTPTVQYCSSVYSGRYQGVSFSLGDLTQFELKKETYNTICCIEGIEHIDSESQKTAVREFAKGLMVGGTLVISSPSPLGDVSGPNPANPHHLSELTTKDFIQLLETAFGRGAVEVISQENVLSNGERVSMNYAVCHKK